MDMRKTKKSISSVLLIYLLYMSKLFSYFSSRKVMEYYFKKTFYGEGISAIPPPDYAERFGNFMSEKVFK